MAICAGTVGSHDIFILRDIHGERVRGEKEKPHLFLDGYGVSGDKSDAEWPVDTFRTGYTGSGSRDSGQLYDSVPAESQKRQAVDAVPSV